MLTKNEVNALNLSPTKKDFVQIWNELLEVSGKLSERWDPTSTNESDPGIVILKALTGIADKLNYNIDKNILEAFMPTAAQEESMRKLCEMLGYSVKYYQSAQTDVLIKYHNSDPEADESEALRRGLSIPKFTVITNGDQDINYFTINEVPFQISSTTPSVRVPCMEGQIVKCESINEDSIITISQITEDNRFYLPETQVAENGFFIYNIYSNDIFGDGLIDGASWEKVDNLNTQIRGSRVFKFGYDSFESRPYIEFPDDYTELFGEGIFIYYTRTNGAQGNISPRTLTQLEFPNSEGWDVVASESFSVENTFAATSGANPETIKQAYRNYKKTVGTFETLVTCRDYMNKIYSMISDVTGKPLVSNVLVTDIRNDLNRAVTICSCDDAGIFYKETPLYKPVTEPWKLQVADKKITHASDILKPKFEENNWFVGGLKVTKRDSFIQEASTEFDGHANGTVATGTMVEGGETFYTITQGDKTFFTFIKPAVEEVTVSGGEQEVTIEGKQPLIDHFDLVLYPYKVYNQIKSDFKDIQQVYDSSFSYTNTSLPDITYNLQSSNLNTLAHVLKSPDAGHIVSINNYLRLNATISTTSKITAEEGMIIIDRIKAALANAFNLRELDFGEEIPFDTILDIMEKADSRIKVISLNTPDLYTTFTVLDEFKNNGVPVLNEYAVHSSWFNNKDAQDTGKFFRDELGDLTATSDYFDSAKAREYYNTLAVRNILAGRVPLFKTDDTFKTSFSEGLYRVSQTVERPASLDAELPNEANPFIVFTENNATYVCRWYLDEDGEEQCSYSKIFTPETLQDGILSEIQGNEITAIETVCEIPLENGETEELELVPGEVIKFRAPNFTTIKTYPAYVNYHLALSAETILPATPALSTDLFSILNINNNNSTPNAEKSWQKVLDYFKAKDKASKGTAFESTYVHTVPVSQTISAYNAEVPEITLKDQVGPVILDLENVEEETQKYSLEEYFRYSGCLKLTSNKAKLVWAPKDGETAPGGEGPDTLEIEVPDTFNPFITNMSDINALGTATDEAITNLIGVTDAKTKKLALPTECSWKVIYEFECVPFLAGSLSEWENFIRTCARQKSEKSGAYKDVLTFVPKEELGVILWRAFDDTGASVGRYTTINFEKMLSFGRGYFGLLPDVYLRGIYLVERFGAEASATQILNDEEYELKQNEYLYIEYTPSSTTEDGTTQNLPAITEKLGPGTIIRPSGFETGLTDSSMKDASSFKTVDFVTDTGSGIEQIQMYALGANEQIEVRDFARTTLDRSTFNNLAGVWIYKNFDCPELESDTVGIKTYTLKDGEYIFYTDKDKAELAYFTSGTQVKLHNKVRFPVFEKIDISTIFDSGISEIPWQYVSLADSGDKIIFQEFQYVTLTGGDTLQKLALAPNETILSSDWKKCVDAEYLLSSNKDKPEKLPPINVYTPFEGEAAGTSVTNGWEVCCLLELNVSATGEQMLRQTDKINTGIKLIPRATGGSNDELALVIPNDTADESKEVKNLDTPLYFKTNLTCQTSGSNITINDLLYNPKNLTGFTVKLFNKEEPALVKTEPNSIIPSRSSNIVNLLEWPGDPISEKADSELWNAVSLETLADRTDTSEQGCERALRVSTYIPPSTYGMVCFYLKYANGVKLNEVSTWIELDHHMSTSDVEYFNRTDVTAAAEESPHRFYLTPGMNCLRINNSGRLFVKTSDKSKGQLLFDDLRLIKVETHEDLTTRGLNLDQLGYLDASDRTDDAQVGTLKIDTENQELLQKIYSEKVSNTIYKEESSVKKSTNIKEVDENSDKLFRLAKAEQALLEDLFDVKLKEITASSSVKSINTTLANKFKRLCTDLSRIYALEKDLDTEEVKDQLKLEADLVTILEQKGYSQTEKVVRELLAELRKIMQVNLESLTDTELDTALNFDYINSAETGTVFESSTITSEEPTAFDIAFNETLTDLKSKLIACLCDLENTIKADIRTNIEYEFNKGLAEIQDTISKTATTEERAQLLNTIQSLLVDSRASKHAAISHSINQINSIFGEGDISTQLSTALRLATSQDGIIQLDQIADQLRGAKLLLQNNDISVLVEELSVALTNSDISNVTSVIDKLNSFVDTLNDTDTTAEANSLKAISKSLDDLASAINGGTYSIENKNIGALINQISTIQTSYTNYYNTYVKDCIDALAELEGIEGTSSTPGVPGLTPVEPAVSTITPEEAIVSVIEKLKTSKDNQTVKAITDLETLITNRTTLLTDSEKIGSDNAADAYTTLLELDFVKDAVLAYFGKRLDNFVAALESLLIEGYYKHTNNNEIYKVLGMLINDNLFDDSASHYAAILYDIDVQAKTLSLQLDQAKTDATRVIAILGALPDIQDRSAFSDIFNDTSTELIVLKDIITGLSAINNSTTSLPEQYLKQELFSRLKIELDSSKVRNEALLVTLLKAVCPGVAKEIFNKDTNVFEDEFFVPLFNKIRALSVDSAGNLTSELIALKPFILFDIAIADLVYNMKAKQFTNAAATLSKLLNMDLVSIDSSLIEESLIKKLLKYAFEASKMLVANNTREKRLDTLLTHDKLAELIAAAEAINTQVGNYIDGFSDWFTGYSGSLLELTDETKAAVENTIVSEYKTIQDATNLFEEKTIELSNLSSGSGIEADRLAEINKGCKIELLEDRLLADIKKLDVANEFYYNLKVEDSLAIEFNENREEDNTLMNPRFFYDVNNVNNSFVVSKIDIKYLDSGLQIARSSRLN